MGVLLACLHIARLVFRAVGSTPGTGASSFSACLRIISWIVSTCLHQLYSSQGRMRVLGSNGLREQYLHIGKSYRIEIRTLAGKPRLPREKGAPGANLSYELLPRSVLPAQSQCVRTRDAVQRKNSLLSEGSPLQARRAIRKDRQ